MEPELIHVAEFAECAETGETYGVRPFPSLLRSIVHCLAGQTYTILLSIELPIPQVHSNLVFNAWAVAYRVTTGWETGYYGKPGIPRLV